MCGICACYNSNLDNDKLRKLLLNCRKKIQHRGPDASGIKILDGGIGFIHERLSIIDPESGAQPFYNNNILLTVNGEIYNYKELKKSITINYNYQSNSDCEVIIPLYLQYGINFINKLSGMFSFVLYDTNTKKMFAVRDHIGITPLYYGCSVDGSLWFASEVKALTETCSYVDNFPVGTYYDCSTNCFYKWYNPEWITTIGTNELNLNLLKDELEKSVEQMMMTDVPWGVLLSGGLDSSLIASIICKRNITQPVHTFSIGLEDSPDLISAQKVADYIGSIHHSYTYTVQEGLDALNDVIYHLETYDITTIRASIPMFLLSRKIKALGIKMVLSGEGADEIFGGYLYFHKAPNKEEFYKENVEKLQKLNLYDCLRANKSSSAWGIEVRVPFLDKDFLDFAMNINPAHKMITKEQPMEKYILRKAFSGNYLPIEILWRQKEQFSDGVGFNWIDSLKEYANDKVSDRQMKFSNLLFPYNTPLTKEAYLYRSIFYKHYPLDIYAQTVEQEETIACSTANAIKWDASFNNNLDPSGQFLSNNLKKL